MSETRFTPGPLKAVSKEPVGFHYEISNVELPSGCASGSMGDWHSAYFNISGYFGSYGPHVFVAAPELHEALAEFEYQLGGETDAVKRRFADVRTKARAALAKARGEQS